MPTIPPFALGVVIAMSRHIGEAPVLLTAIAAGGVASVPAAFVLAAIARTLARRRVILARA